MLKQLKVLLFVLFISSCGMKLESGFVIEKWYKPARTYTTIRPICIQSGKMTSVVYMPQTYYECESWNIRIQGTYKDETIVEALSVHNTAYDKIHVGDFVRITNGMLLIQNCSDDREGKKQND